MTTTKATYVTVQAETLVRALTNALLFTAPAKEARPVLSCVKVELTTDELAFVATDSYALIREVVFAPEIGGEADVLLPADELKSVLRLVKVAKPSEVTITFRGDDVVFDVGTTGWAVHVNDADYPKYDQLWPDKAGDGRWAIGTAQLARLGKVKLGGDTKQYGSPVRFDHLDSLKPAVFAIGATIRGLVMPMKVR